MDKETAKIKKWLDKRFTMGVKEGKYFAHQPIYGYKKGLTEGRELIRYIRTLSNLKKISQFKFDNFIDVGGAEGYTANLVKKIFNVNTYTCDLSYQANLRAKELFGLDSVAVDLSNLPFKDGAFDIVLCSEVLEHVTKPVQAIYELKRIAKKALLITTEAICYDKLERKLRMLLVDLSEEHADRNWYLVDDFALVIGENINYENTIPDISSINKPNCTLKEIKTILEEQDKLGSFTRDGLGISILFVKEHDMASNKIDTITFIDTILNTAISEEYNKNKTSVHLQNKLLDMLYCPKCLTAIKKDTNGLICSMCNERYRINQGIPLMYTNVSDKIYLEEKWNRIYMNALKSNYKNVAQLIKLLEHTKVKSNPLIRIIARRILKVKKFMYNTNKDLNKRSIGSAFVYFLKKIIQKIQREIDRLINRLRENKN